ALLRPTQPSARADGWWSACIVGSIGPGVCSCAGRSWGGPTVPLWSWPAPSAVSSSVIAYEPSGVGRFPNKGLAPLLPPQKPATGRPARDHRQMLTAMLWIHATGAQWRALPERYGPWQRVATRCSRWVAAGVWEAIVAALQQQGDASGQWDWSAHFVD